MSEHFRVIASPGRLALEGRIDEHARVADLAARVEPGPLAIDLAGIQYINSLGVRDWVLFLRRLAGKGIPVTLERCADVMVLQMNMINDARGGARIASFYAPFACDACGWEGSTLVVTDEVQPLLASQATPECDCPDCGKRARFADFVDRYFLFLSS